MEFNVSIFVGGTLRGSKQASTPCIIGRSKDVDLTVAHPVMSRKHCELFEEAGKLYLRDNSSLNGTIFKGEYIEKPIPLQIGEEFSVGELTFKIIPKDAPLTEEQYAMSDRPTVSMSAGTEESAGTATILDSTSASKSLAEKILAPKVPVDDAPAENKTPKDSKKISPKDVRIVT